MRCKDAKATIKRLERENFELHKRAYAKATDERVYDFNLLEIVVRPRNGLPIRQYELQADLRVLGCDEMQVPTVCNVKRIDKAAIHLVKENRRDFIKHIGEIMARELVDFADKEIS